MSNSEERLELGLMQHLKNNNQKNQFLEKWQNKAQRTWAFSGQQIVGMQIYEETNGI